MDAHTTTLIVIRGKFVRMAFALYIIALALEHAKVVPAYHRREIVRALGVVIGFPPVVADQIPADQIQVTVIAQAVVAMGINRIAAVIVRPAEDALGNNKQISN